MKSIDKTSENDIGKHYINDKDDECPRCKSQMVSQIYWDDNGNSKWVEICTNNSCKFM